MNPQYQKTLLKGSISNPFEAPDGLSDDFSNLSVLEQFLILDTIYTFAGSLPVTESKPDIAPDEKYPAASIQAVKKFLKLNDQIRVFAIDFFIDLHIRSRLIFHHAILSHVLYHPEIWTEHIIKLPFILRNRARWLSKQKPEWYWWDDALTPTIWSQQENPNRFLYYIILRKSEPAVAAHLLLDSIGKEDVAAIGLMLEIFSSSATEADIEVLEKLTALGIKNEMDLIRCLLVTFKKSQYYGLINRVAEEAGYSVNKLASISWKSNEKLLPFHQPINDHLPFEVLLGNSYDKFRWVAEGESKPMAFYIKRQKNASSICNHFLRAYLLRVDHNSFARLYADLFEAEIDFAMDRINANLLLSLSFEQFNRLLETMHHNSSSSARWHMIHGVYSMGYQPLNHPNSKNMVYLFRLYQGVYNHKSVLSASEPVFLNLAISLENSIQNEWHQQIQSMYTLLAPKVSRKKSFVQQMMDLVHFKNTVRLD